MHDEDRLRQEGWGSGWTAALDKLRVLLTNEIMIAESRLSLNREDFGDENHPAVFLANENLKALRRLARGMDILLPGMWGKDE